MRQGRLLGFDYRVHVAWLLIVAILLVAIVTGIEGAMGERPVGLAALALGAVVVVLLVLSIVAHELTHALTARRLGLPERQISLLVLDRPSDPEPDPKAPGSELVVATAGLALSVLLGLGLVLAAEAAAGSGASSGLHWIAWWLGLANLLLAGLYAVPVLPLDGGRIVRAVVWAVTRDLDRAGAVTAFVGRMFGYLVIGGGLFIAATADVFYGVWIVLLGWFTTRLARAGVDRRRMQQLTAGLTVDDATDPRPATVPPMLTVELLLAQDDELGQGVYPVLDGTDLVGVVFPRQLRGLLRRTDPTKRVGDIAIAIDQTSTFRPDEPLIRAVERLEAMRVDGLPVLGADDPGRLHGVVTRARVLDRLRVRHAMAQARDGSASVDVRS